MKLKTLISGLCILLAICLAIYFYAEWQKARFDASLPVPPAPSAEEQTGGHWHDGEWHADDAHVGNDELYVDAHVAKAKAWAKVDYIAENPFAWGGNVDSRTEGLIAQLMSGPEDDEGRSEESIQLEMGQLLDELISLRDPRAIKTIVAYLIEDNRVSSRFDDFFDFFLDIGLGPPMIPYLLPYLLEGPPESDEAFEAFDTFVTVAGCLSIIGERHREELDGIVEYIILPKLEEILASASYVKRHVSEDIDRLK